MIERRQTSRTDIDYRIFFICLDADDAENEQDIGKALDINEKGMLLESTIPIHSLTVKIIMSIGGEKDIEVTGGVIYTIRVADDTYRTGIYFHDPPENMSSVIEKVVAASSSQKS